MIQVPISLLTLIAGILTTLASLWVGQNYQWLLPEQVSEQAPLVDNLFAVMLVIGTAFFFVVQGALFIFAIAFRRRPGDDSDGSPVEGNIPLEIVWTAIPAIIVICLGVYSVEVYAEMGGFDSAGQELMMAAGHPAHSHGHTHGTPEETHESHFMDSAIAASLDDLDAMPEGMSMEEMSMESVPPEAKTHYNYGIGTATGQSEVADLVVNVTGMQYAWLFEYPDTGILDGELHVPIGQSVQLNLNAVDVIHSFWLPQFRLKQDALPGQSSQLRFVATKIGTYPVVCAELCGSYHGSMRTQIIVHDPEEYEAWENSMLVAQANTPAPIIVATKDLSDRDYLQPYGAEMGIDRSVLAIIQNP